MKVLSLVGPSGVGKSSIWDRLGSRGYVHFKESYMDSNRGASGKLPEIDNRLFASKLNYMANWLTQMREYRAEGVELVLSDRCPYDVPAFVTPENTLFAYVDAFMRELPALGIEHRTCYVRCDPKIVAQRVEDRLRVEAFRREYNESDSALLAKTIKYFERHASLWDFSVENSGSIEDTVAAVDAMLQSVRKA